LGWPELVRFNNRQRALRLLPLPWAAESSRAGIGVLAYDYGAYAHIPAAGDDDNYRGCERPQDRGSNSEGCIAC